MFIAENGKTRFGMGYCPNWERARPAAVVNVERPFLVTLGFLLLAFGFLVQYLAVPNSDTISTLRG
jgi:hypothetical protein